MGLLDLTTWLPPELEWRGAMAPAASAATHPSIADLEPQDRQRRKDLAALRTRAVFGYWGLPALYGPAIKSRYCEGVFDAEMRSWLPATSTS